ncbi:MAG: hypothetical protein Q9179_000330 [Wetmoreana sp. 5 TL-2023]
MAQQFPSIQSFFQPEMYKPEQAVTVENESGDGFTAAEMETAIHPTSHDWQPPNKYQDTQISDLTAGARCVTVTARVVNYYDPQTSSKKPYGCLKVLVRDDTGTLLVLLWYAKVDYHLLLGQLVQLWTTRISNLEASTSQNTVHVVTLHPERDHKCCFKVQTVVDDGILFKKPLSCSDGNQLAGLMTLKNYIEGGHEVADGKVLVCVKSIGGRKTITTKKGQILDIVNVIIFDDTCEATFVLYGRVTTSTAYWKISHTILLLSSPSFRGDKGPMLGINSDTQVDVDPCMTDAEWLRSFAQKPTTSEAVDVPFPEGGRKHSGYHGFGSADILVFEVEAAISGDVRLLYTLAEIDEW